ncbi:UDP-N-acetylglucosamine 2-epimerase [Burkholderia singularis]|uniref:UDP-N-acetylglucosamine 2-epimerase (non-hydrolyzing) n=2 Tax=Burkholderia singularis TaxID=1503053 RepID=A0A238H7J9_9BURK|nr:UDP-N-acetylglucosamine 2-epimerase [Burkholderia singularis]
MAPVIKALKARTGVNTRVLATAQHRHMLDQIFANFGIAADIDLDVMQPDQSLAALTSRLLMSLDGVLSHERPQLVLAQGDTTTVMSVAIASFYRKIPFGHIEAGLRTGIRNNPFPEEMNRVLVGNLADLHFAPTESARANLLNAGIRDDSIWVTGNTVIDALLDTVKTKPALNIPLDPVKRLLLVTAHRRENFGEPLADICRALATLVEQNDDIQILFPVHPNPNVKQTVHALLGRTPRVFLVPPLDYAPFVAAMQRAHLILSDSGGVQEEAPALAKPVLVLRSQTERPEAVAAGVVKIVGSRSADIVASAQTLLDSDEQYRTVARGVSPYGDGLAAQRIADIVTDRFA